MSASAPLLAAPLLGGRLLELRREPGAREWALALVQQDGRDRRGVGTFTLTDAELPLFEVTVAAMLAYAKSASPERRAA